MFEIYADEQCFFNDISPLKELQINSPKLSLSDNSAGSFEFTLPRTNVAYDLIQCLSTKIVIYRDKEEIWEGRAIREQKDFTGNRKITCEGELGYLNDTIQSQRELVNQTPYTFLSSIIAEHNSVVGADKSFTVGIVTVMDKLPDETGEDIDDEDDHYTYLNFETTLESISNKLIDKFNGHLRIRKQNGVRYLDYLEDYVDTSTQTIDFGKNLMDFVINYDETDFCTSIIPLGAPYDETSNEGFEEYLDICEVNGGKNYLVNQTAVNTFGWIQKVVHFDEFGDGQEAELLAKGQEYLSDIQFGDMTLEVKAVDLHYLNADVEAFKMLYEIPVLSTPHGLHRTFPITKIEMQLDNPANTTFTLGEENVKGLSYYNTKTEKNAMNAIRKMPSKSNILNEAQIRTASLINSATNGYITIEQRDHKTQALYISKEANYETSQKKWVWNSNGLGYTDDNGVTYKVAITMNGEISANFITTGTLNAANITVTNLSANSITSGTLNADQVTVQTGGTTGSRLQIKGGKIEAFYDNSSVGSIDTFYTPNGMGGLQLNANKSIWMNCDNIYIKNGGTYKSPVYSMTYTNTTGYNVFNADMFTATQKTIQYIDNIRQVISTTITGVSGNSLIGYYVMYDQNGSSTRVPTTGTTTISITIPQYTYGYGSTILNYIECTEKAGSGQYAVQNLNATGVKKNMKFVKGLKMYDGYD